MSDSDENALRTNAKIDLASVELDYEGFRQLAANPHLSSNEKIGFPDSYRNGYEDAIFADIAAKVPALLRSGQVIVDVGPGCAGLPRMIIDACKRNSNRLVLVDSREMLDQLPTGDDVFKVEGLFPRNLTEVCEAMGRLADGIVCYSVLHYLYVDTNLFDIVDVFCDMLAPGGSAILGDVPNLSKRKRFFSSETGRRFHENFTSSGIPPEVKHLTVERGKIDDSVLAAIISRAQASGCDAYLVPQPHDLPMSNRRDDVLIRRP